MLTYILLVILSFTILIIRRIKWYRHRRQYEEFYKTKQFFYLPILGNTYYLLGKNVLRHIEFFNKAGKQCLIYLPHRTYVTREPEEIKIILNQAIDKSNEYNHLKVVLDNTLLLFRAPIWKKHRKILARGFRQNILDTFVPTFNTKCKILSGILENKRYSDIYACFEKYTLEIFVEATLGVKSSTVLQNKNSYVKYITNTQKLIFKRAGHIIKMNDFLFKFFPDAREINKLAAIAANFIQRIIQVKKMRIKNDNDLTFNEQGLPLLDLLLDVAKKENFTEEYIIKETNLFASAATDTTAYSMIYTFLMLAMHPDVQQKVYDEVTTVIGHEEVDVNHLCQLKYTEMAIMESMRLLPVIPTVGRYTEEDIDIGTKVIPKGTGILISILGLHRDEDIYPEPMKFDPNRFLPENKKQRHPYSLLAFSGGPRNCIGKKYAQMLLKLTIASIIRNFEIQTNYKSVSDLKFESSVVMMPSHPLDLQFIPRHSKF